MNNKIAIAFITCVLACLNGLPAFASDNSEEAVGWLERMSHALKNENYQGIFTYIRGSTFDTVRIVHRVKDGAESERLFNLNGEVRELYRHDGSILCYHPLSESDSEHSISDHSVQIGPFSPVFSERVLATQDYYRLSMHGEDRIAGRAAVKLAISPKSSDRYGYFVWLDKESGLLLQSHLVGRGSVKEIFQFTNLTIGAEISDLELASVIPGETVSHALTLDTNELAGKPTWRVAWLPVGFRPVRVKGNRLHFTDGLATFSVFVENSNDASLPDMNTTVGGTVVITRRLKNSGRQITVVGEVPVRTARRVAESVEPVIY